MSINPKIFRAYDIRGVYPSEIDSDTAYRIGWAFARYFKNDLGMSQSPRIVVGQDMRGSSPFLARELIRGLTESGVNVVDIGRAPTPALYYCVAFKGYEGGIMVTASHNPKEYNGFKLCRQKAIPIAEGSGLEKIKEYALSAEEHKELPRDQQGRVEGLAGMTPEYVTQDLSYMSTARFGRLKIAADPANAMGAMYLEELFKRIDAEAIKLNWTLNGNMPVHEANPLKKETLQQIQEVIRNEKADFGIATDGDGDRIGFLDEQGEVIPPHAVLSMVAEKLLEKQKGAKVGYDLRMSRSVKEIIEQKGGIAVETPAGHSYIKKIMSEQDLIFAGELSMHYYFRENFNFESPVFVIAVLLQIRSELEKPFSQIWKKYQIYFHSGEINFDVSDKSEAMQKFKEKYADGQLSELDGVKIEYPDWWFSVRASNTEPLLRLNLEADSEELMKQKLEEIQKVIARSE